MIAKLPSKLLVSAQIVTKSTGTFNAKGGIGSYFYKGETMSSLTFESSGSYGRRALARRAASTSVKRAVQKTVPLEQVAIRNQQAAVAEKKSKLSFTVLAVAIIGLHLYGYYWLTLPGNKEALVKLSPLSFEIAPPPPPVEKPKPPEPKIIRATPQKAVVVPNNVPVVNSPVDPVATSADTVAVAAAQPPAPSAPVPVPEPVTEPRGFAGYKNNPAPAYPAVAQRRGLEGTVLLRVHVLASGLTDDVKIGKSSGHSILDEAAVKAVLSWIFDPAKRGKTPIDGNVSVPIIFKL